MVLSLPHPLIRGPLNADIEGGFLRVMAVPATHPGPPHPSAIFSQPQLQSESVFGGQVLSNAVNKLDIFAQNGPDAKFLCHSPEF